MAQIEFEIKNDNSKKALDGAKTQILAALDEMGLVAEGYAKRLCPVDTGRLRNSISHATAILEQVEYIGTNVEYAPYVELGTRKQKPQPYLKPAATNHSEEYKNILKKYLQGS